MESLEHCINTCSVSDYPQCWQQGLEALQQNPNLMPDQRHRKALIRRLQSYLKSTDGSGDVKNASLNVRKSMH